MCVHSESKWYGVIFIQEFYAQIRFICVELPQNFIRYKQGLIRYVDLNCKLK